MSDSSEETTFGAGTDGAEGTGAAVGAGAGSRGGSGWEPGPGAPGGGTRAGGAGAQGGGAPRGGGGGCACHHQAREQKRPRRSRTAQRFIFVPGNERWLPFGERPTTIRVTAPRKQLTASGVRVNLDEGGPGVGGWKATARG